MRRPDRSILSRKVQKPAFDPSSDLTIKSVVKIGPNECRPIYITKSDNKIGARIGGMPPKDVAPAVIKEGETEYLLTIPWVNESELSLFIWLSHSLDGKNNVLKNSRVIHDSSNALVQAVIHSKAARSNNELLASSLRSNGLRIESVRPDAAPWDSFVPWQSHKLGGTAVFRDAGSLAYDKTKELLADDFAHVLQLCFPRSEDAPIDGSWPFGDVTFHLFAKTITNASEFKFIWD
jgi:hypothetical protein